MTNYLFPPPATPSLPVRDNSVGNGCAFAHPALLVVEYFSAYPHNAVFIF